MSETMWHYVEGGARHGPVPEATITDLIAQGRITAKTRVWTEGQGEWRPARETPLFGSFEGGAPPATASTGSPTKFVRRVTPLWRTVQIFLWLFAAATAVQIYATVQVMAVLERIRTQNFSSQQEIVDAANAVDLFAMTVSRVTFGLYVITAFLFLKLTYRAMRNLRDAGVRASISPGWAIGYYFIPILTWWKPLEAVQQIWRGSASPDSPETERVPASIGWWWFFWIIGTIAGNASFQLSLRSGVFDPAQQPSVETLELIQIMGAVSDVTSLAATPLIFMFWGKIAQRQDQHGTVGTAIAVA